jgi:hypothetical protein
VGTQRLCEHHGKRAGASRETQAAVRSRGGTLRNLTAGFSPQEQPVKSVRATLLVVAGVTFKG